MVVILKNKKKKDILLNRQKNRFKKKIKFVRFVYGDSLILNTKQGFLELVQLMYFKKLLKKTLLVKINKEINFRREKFFFFLKQNFFLQEKVINSRMGKGKGKFKRKIINIKQNSTIFEFSGISFYKLKWLVLKFNKRSKLGFFFFRKKIKVLLNWFSKNKSQYKHFYKKYLYY